MEILQITLNMRNFLPLIKYAKEIRIR